MRERMIEVGVEPQNSWCLTSQILAENPEPPSKQVEQQARIWNFIFPFEVEKRLYNSNRNSNELQTKLPSWDQAYVTHDICLQALYFFHRNCKPVFGLDMYDAILGWLSNASQSVPDECLIN